MQANVKPLQPTLLLVIMIKTNSVVKKIYGNNALIFHLNMLL